jgi:hypothetical protein
VSVRVEAEPTPEPRLPAELILGRVFDQRDEPAMDVLLLPEHLAQR